MQMPLDREEKSESQDVQTEPYWHEIALPVQHGTVVKPYAARDPAAEGIVRGTHDPEMARDWPIRPFPQMDIGIQGPS